MKATHATHPTTFNTRSANNTHHGNNSSLGTWESVEKILNLMSNNYKGCFFHVNKSLDILSHDISYMNNKQNMCYIEFHFPTKNGAYKNGRLFLF